MRTLFISLILVLTLAACGTKDDAVEEPMDAAAPAAEEATTPAAQPNGKVTSTNTLKDEVPDGIVGTLQLTNGQNMEIVELVKLGGYYLYIDGELNGRASTVISFTRFQDVRRWDAFIFKDQNNFIITTKTGKELIFMNTRLFLGTDSNDTYGFYSFNENFEKVYVEVPKSEVATIKIN